MNKDQVLHADEIVKGPDMNELLTSLGFEQQVDGPKMIPLPFELKKGVWAVPGARVRGGGRNEYLVVSGMIRHATSFGVCKLIGIVHNQHSIRQLFNIENVRPGDTYVMFEAYYDLRTKTGAICIGLVPCEEAGRLVRSLPRWE